MSSGTYVPVARLGGDTQPSEYSRRVQILIDDGSYVVAPDGAYSVDNPQHLRPHDVFIEPSASRRAALKAAGNRWMIIDPQHGGSVAPWSHTGESGDAAYWDRRDSEGRPVAACIAAFRAGGPHGTGEYERIFVRPDAGLDDYAAAAVEADMIRPLPYSQEVRRRLEAISIADNVSWAGLPEWAPGQRIDDVTTTFPGLGRICASSALTPRRRAELVALWLMTGDIVEPPEIAQAGLHAIWRRSGIPAIEVYGRGEELTLIGWPSGYADPYSAPGGCIPILDTVAVREREAVAPRVEHPAVGGSIVADSRVVIVRSPMTGLSGGRGAIGYGYRYAPVVVACSPLPRADVGDGWSEGRRLVTIARAPNARRLSVDWRALLDALNRAEGLLDETPGWGGNLTSGIIGSPKPGGTALTPEEIAAIVARHISVS